MAEHDRLATEELSRWWKEAGGWQLRQLLFWRWDPIGVSFAFPSTHDEYDGYAGPVARRLNEGAGVEEIAAFLQEAEEETMGLTSGPGADRRRRNTAELIVDWYRRSIEFWRPLNAGSQR